MKVTSSRQRTIKKAQREKLLLREVSSLLMDATYQDGELKDIIVSKVELSADGGICYIFFCTDPLSLAKEKLERLKLYGPSMRTALAHRLDKRYTPEIIFKIDELFDKRRTIENILNALPDEEKQ